MFKDLYEIAKDGNLGFFGFLSLALMVVLGLGIKRAATYVSGLNGQWVALIDEGAKMRAALHEELQEAREIIMSQRVTLDEQRVEIEALRIELRKATLAVVALRTDINMSQSR